MQFPIVRLFIILQVSPSIVSYSQNRYQEILLLRISEIERLEIFDNSFVAFTEATGYGSNFPVWSEEIEYYEDDLVLDKNGSIYRVLKDNSGKVPHLYPHEWELVPWKHPYFFLRDTATVEDLRKLIHHQHPYVRTYAFGALANKKYDGLYQVILRNLKDMTRITQVTGDVGFDVYPVELMISYAVSILTREEVSNLRKLLNTDYKNLLYAKKILRDKYGNH